MPESVPRNWLNLRIRKLEPVTVIKFMRHAFRISKRVPYITGLSHCLEKQIRTERRIKVFLAALVPSYNVHVLVRVNVNVLTLWLATRTGMY